jgi:hypothetical protein
MEITFRVEILILIVIVLIILWGHLLCSCAKVDLKGVFGKFSKKMTPNQHQYELVMSNPGYAEGFTGANINNGQSATYNVTEDKPVDTSSWFSPNLTFGPGQKPGKGAEEILNRQPQPVPLPEDELLMFANTPFKPECCSNGGSAYSNSSGCACITMPQYNYLINRGGNNEPYSEY